MGIEMMINDTTPLAAAPLVQAAVPGQPVLAAKTPAVATPAARLSLGAARGLMTCGPQAQREASQRR